MSKNSPPPCSVPVLGLDLSLNSTGWSLHLPGQEPLTGLLEPEKKMTGIPRLLCLQERLISVVREYALHGQETAVFLEDYAFGSSSHAFGLGEWGGIARITLAQWNLSVFAVSPGTLKKFVFGKGSGSKSEMLLGVFKRWGVSFSNDDKADAYALAQLGRAYLNPNPHPLSEKQTDIFKAVKVLHVRKSPPQPRFRPPPP